MNYKQPQAFLCRVVEEMAAVAEYDPKIGYEKLMLDGEFEVTRDQYMRDPQTGAKTGTHVVAVNQVGNSRSMLTEFLCRDWVFHKEPVRQLNGDMWGPKERSLAFMDHVATVLKAEGSKVTVRNRADD